MRADLEQNNLTLRINLTFFKFNFMGVIMSRLGILVGIVLTCFLASAEETPWFLKQTEGCFMLNNHFHEDGKKPTFSNFKEWVTLKLDNQTWIETHYNERSKTAHWAMRWNLGKNEVWKSEQVDPNQENAVLYSCSSKGVEFTTQPSGVKSFVRRCEALGAPMPARDSRRSREDYNKLDRIHVVRFTEKAITDTQRNTKKMDDKLISTEEGLVEYIRLEDKECDSFKP